MTTNVEWNRYNNLTLSEVLDPSIEIARLGDVKAGTEYVERYVQAILDHCPSLTRTEAASMVRSNVAFWAEASGQEIQTLTTNFFDPIVEEVMA